MSKALKIGITFNEVDSDVYDFLKSDAVNASQLVRKLVEKYMFLKNFDKAALAVLLEDKDLINPKIIEKVNEEPNSNEEVAIEKEENIEKLSSNQNSLKSLYGAYGI